MAGALGSLGGAGLFPAGVGSRDCLTPGSVLPGRDWLFAGGSSEFLGEGLRVGVGFLGGGL